MSKIKRIVNLYIIDVISGRGGLSIWLFGLVLVTVDRWGWRNGYAPLVSVDWRPD